MSFSKEKEFGLEMSLNIKTNNMKTFNDEIKELNQKYSYEKLYLTKTYSDKSQKWIFGFSIVSIVGFIIGDIMMIVNVCPKAGNIIMILSGIPIIIYVFGVKTYQARKELKSKGLPLPNQFYKWKSTELESNRINKVYKKYSVEDDDSLNAKIKLAKEKANEPIKNPFVFFDKLFGFIGTQFVLVVIAIFLFLYKENSTTENLDVLLRYVIGFLLMSGAVAFVWEYLLKKPYLDTKLSEKEKLKDYAFVLENIVLMKNSSK